MAKLFTIDKIICLLIILTVPFFYCYELVPDKKEVDFVIFKYESIYYQSLYALAWALVQKIIIIFLIFIWYTTNKNWWKYSLVAPIFMFIYQSIYLLVEDCKPKDEFMNSWNFVAPSTLIVIIFLHYISIGIQRRIELLNLNKIIEDEIEKASRS
ncbi:hypothetical protein JJC03_09390 [Flavobacterium oreochromis]|uniref:hypothetical protein n=1 Tax=Flavobacterium oreochromis TaxID=2906078 RepID=UPI001CE65F10|nr:hypothetical protein [Flavobacterium oreochromis]QYS85451.1 hypothetical protein JJC03_09390 [Flavobacterium oreochromis]